MSSTTFPANWFDQNRIAAIMHAPVTGVAGSAERIQLVEKLRELKFDQKAEIENAFLKGWAHGAIAGWSQETLATRMGPMPMGDGDRNLLRLSCQALKVWEYVKARIPQVQEEEDFATDIDDEELIDSPADLEAPE